MVKKRNVDCIKIRINNIKTGLLAAAVAADVGIAGWTLPVENAVYDFFSEFRLRLGIKAEPSEPVIVAVDHRSLKEYGSWPWPRKRLAELVGKVSEGGPRVLGLDFLFSEEGENDSELAAALVTAGNTVLIEHMDFRMGRRLFYQQIRLGEQERVIPVIKASVTGTGFADLWPEEDGVVREVPLRVEVENEVYPSFAGKLLTLWYGEYAPARDRLRLTIGRESPAFTMVPAADLLAGRVSPKVFQDRMVLVGLTAPGVTGDWFRVAVKRIGLIPGVVLHAYGVATALVWGETKKVHPFFSLIFILFAGLIGTVDKGTGAFRKPVFFSLFPIGVFTGTGIFFAAGFWIEPVRPLLAGFLSRLILTARETARLRAEEKRVRLVFARYLSPAVMNEVLRGPHPELGGERRVVTVMFADIRGFTAFVEEQGPEKVVQVLNRHLSIMSEVIFYYEGTIDKYLGDSVMAFFGAPLWHMDHKQRALTAAWDIICTLSGEEDTLPLGIGIASGEVMVGNIGGVDRFEYTAIGDPVNVAARLQTLAGPGEILATEETLTVLDKKKITGWREISLKGRKNPVRVGVIKPEKNRQWGDRR